MKDDWKEIVDIKDCGDGSVLITEKININHPNCPIVLIPDDWKDYRGS